MKKQLRPLGDITLDLEPLLDEMAIDHDLQMGEILYLIKAYLDIHIPSCKEEYLDGSNPIMKYGHE